jgi:peptidoglycan/xylan/chitin deacetylase (PgdA/CDA1 family)
MHITSRGFPLFLTFDIDAETMWTARDPALAQRPVLMSQASYGWKIGVWRIMEFLRKYDIKTTFFIPGLVVEQRPHVVEALLKDGHEISHHSYTHAWITKLSPEQEREEMERGFQAIKKATGYAPRGYRSPVGELSPVSLDLMLEYGFSYSSNFADNDSPYLLSANGRQTDIVELCWRWAMDDATFFHYHPGVLPGRTMQAPSVALETWKAEFDVLHAEDNRFLMIAMHPQVIGQPARMKMLDEFIQYALSHNDVHIGRCDQVTDEMRARLRAA